MVKKKRVIFFALIMTVLVPVFFAGSFYLQFEKMYKNKIYPGVTIDNISFEGKMQSEVEDYFNDKNKIFGNSDILLVYEDKIATLSASQLKAGYDAKLSSTQAFSVGRSGSFLSDLYQKYRAKNLGVRLQSVLTMDSDYVDETIIYLSEAIDKPSEDALFNFSDRKVKLFSPSKNGLKLDREKTKSEIIKHLATISNSSDEQIQIADKIDLPVEVLYPSIPSRSCKSAPLTSILSSIKSFIRSLNCTSSTLVRSCSCASFEIPL